MLRLPRVRSFRRGLGILLALGTSACSGKPPAPELPKHLDGTICGVMARGADRECSVLVDTHANGARGRYTCPDAILYFEPGSLALPANSRHTFAQLVEEMARSHVALVEVVTLGVRGEHQDMPFQRAAALIDVLVRDYGVSRARLVAVQGSFAPSASDPFDFTLGLPHVTFRATRCADGVVEE